MCAFHPHEYGNYDARVDVFFLCCWYYSCYCYNIASVIGMFGVSLLLFELYLQHCYRLTMSSLLLTRLPFPNTSKLISQEGLLLCWPIYRAASIGWPRGPFSRVKSENPFYDNESALPWQSIEFDRGERRVVYLILFFATPRLSWRVWFFEAILLFPFGWAARAGSSRRSEL